MRNDEPHGIGAGLMGSVLVMGVAFMLLILLVPILVIGDELVRHGRLDTGGGAAALFLIALTGVGVFVPLPSRKRRAPALLAPGSAAGAATISGQDDVVARATRDCIVRLQSMTCDHWAVVEQRLTGVGLPVVRFTMRVFARQRAWARILACARRDDGAQARVDSTRNLVHGIAAAARCGRPIAGTILESAVRRAVTAVSFRDVLSSADFKSIYEPLEPIVPAASLPS